MWKIPAMFTKTRGGGQYFDISTFTGMAERARPLQCHLPL